MAKGDSGKAQNMINTQGTLAQNYLSSLQSQQAQQSQLAQQLYYGGGGTQGSQTTTGSNGLPDNATQQKIMDYIKERQGQLPATKDSLNQIVKELQGQGYDVQFARHGANKELESDDKIILPGGTMIDTISDVGGSGAGWTSNYTEGPSGYGFTGNSNQNAGSLGGAQQDYQNIQNQYQDFAKTGGFSPQDIASIRARSVAPIRSVYSSAENALERQKALQGGYSPNYTAAKAKMAREQSMATSEANTNVEGMLAQMRQQGKLAGLGGMSSLYGTTPAFANMMGNQMDSSMGRGINLGQLQNQLGLGLIGGQIDKSKVPSTYSQVLGNIGNTAKVAGGILAPWL